MQRSWIFNDDLTTNILCRLPAKTLHILKFVSKEWRNLISNHSFIRLQLKKTEPVSGFFFQDTGRWMEVAAVSYIQVDAANPKVHREVLDFLPEQVLILSSNSGLLCCRSCLSASETRLYVCNPLNKQWTSIEWPNFCPRDSSVALVFDPSGNHPIDVSTDFKLVAVSVDDEDIEDDDPYWFLFDVYSSKTASWRELKEGCQGYFSFHKNHGVFVEGVLYWLLLSGDEILAFNTQTELPELITTPIIDETEITNSIPFMCIGESQGKLCYAVFSEFGIQLWVLEDRLTSKWELKISTTLEKFEMENSSVLDDISGDSCWMEPLAFKDGTLLVRYYANVYSYQFDAMKMKKLCNISKLGLEPTHDSPIVVPYNMSLFPLAK